MICSSVGIDGKGYILGNTGVLFLTESNAQSVKKLGWLNTHKKKCSSNLIFGRAF
jgi:hypothetical protein